MLNALQQRLTIWGSIFKGNLSPYSSPSVPTPSWFFLLTWWNPFPTNSTVPMFLKQIILRRFYRNIHTVFKPQHFLLSPLKFPGLSKLYWHCLKWHINAAIWSGCRTQWGMWALQNVTVAFNNRKVSLDMGKTIFWQSVSAGNFPDC